MSSLRIIAAQINPIVGDIEGNAEKTIVSALAARDQYHADAVVFPEMTITGYPAEDLLLRPELYLRVKKALTLIKQKVKNIYLIIGHPENVKHNNFNAASIIYNNKVILTYHKQQLPNYGVFDEKRYFIADTAPAGIFQIKNFKIALTICEDLWFPETMAQALKAGAQLMISLNASPFDMHKSKVREQVMGKRAREGNMPIIYVNCVGGQDELVFDGGSMVLNSQGRVTQRADFFQETLLPIDFNTKNQHPNNSHQPRLKSQLVPCPQKVLPFTSYEEHVYKALVLGVRDYINKNNFRGALVSVSGGIDSALTLTIAVDALGKERVETVYMPSRYSSSLSEKIVRQQAKTLDVKLSILSIAPIIKEFSQSLANEFAGYAPDITEENLQARCRAVLLMALSNKKRLIVLSTSNKSEIAVGYSTLYGDMVGGFCVLKDVPKTLVYRIANYRNAIGSPCVIPPSVIARAPSAELAPNQKDTDSLPAYSVLDKILELYIEQDQSPEKIIAAGFKSDVVNKVVNMVKRNEYKRRQAPPGVRVSIKAFGRDRRYPLTSGF